MFDDDDGVRSGCLVPGLQAIGTALLIGSLTACILYAYGADIGPNLASVSGAAGIFAACVWWTMRLSDWRTVELSQVHQVATTTYSVQADDRKRTERVKVEVISDGGRAGDYIDLPDGIDTARMAEVCRRLSRPGAAFSHAFLAGKGKPLSRAEYELLQALFLGRGLAVWTNERAHGRGLELTGAGRAIVRKFAEIDDYSPTEDVIDG